VNAERSLRFWAKVDDADGESSRGCGFAWKRLLRRTDAAYSTVQVNPQKFLLQLRTRIDCRSRISRVYSLESEVDQVADDLIRVDEAGRRGGAGFGLGIDHDYS